MPATLRAMPGRFRFAQVLAATAVLAACSPEIADSADPASNYGGLDASLPIVDLSEPPVADAPDVADRAGVAADHVECRFDIWQGGWSMDFGPLGSGPNPDAALAALLDEELLTLPNRGFVAVGQDQDRVLYTNTVGGSPRAAVVVADSSNVALDGDDRWVVEVLASCDPAEFDPDQFDQLPFQIWLDADGNRVATTQVQSFPGPEHCGWESATFLTIEGTSYIADPDNVLADGAFVVPFDDDTELPSDAVETGYHRDSRELSVSSDRVIAFVVDGDDVQAWPSPIEDFACA